MCKINCSGGCMECDPEEHLQESSQADSAARSMETALEEATIEFKDQLTKAEQRVAEACIAYANHLCRCNQFYRSVFIDGIRSEEWRKFVKEV